MPELTEEQKRAALTPPPARQERRRVERRVDNPPVTRTGVVAPGPMYSTVAPVAAPVAGPSAVQRLYARTAEQAFLPLVSKLAKFNEAKAEVEVALQQALGAGVDRQGLELSLMQLTHKNGLDWSAVPESVRQLLSPAPAEPARQPRRRAEQPAPEAADAANEPEKQDGSGG